jgi:hypothetical protein
VVVDIQPGAGVSLYLSPFAGFESLFRPPRYRNEIDPIAIKSTPDDLGTARAD